MKNSVFFLLVLLHTSCLTNKGQQEGKATWSDLLQSQRSVVFENVVFDEVVDFTDIVEKAMITDGLYSHMVKSSVCFINCTFEKEVKAGIKENNNVHVTTFGGDVSFQGCTFKGEVNFRGSTFQGRALFANATFKAATNFEEASFYHLANFKGCKFEEDVRFQNSSFLQRANFMKSEFFGAVSFQSVVFNEEVQFGAGKFYKYTDFSLVDCRAAVLFNYAEFMERADFSNAYFGRDINFTRSWHQRTNFDNSQFIGNAQFIDCTTQESVSFENVYFLKKQPDFVSTFKVSK